ncbi:MAG: hypothetical protein LBE56_13595 [Tannerella sp.]|nr:hypothetical protein [Tannerella sp.]
MDTFQEELSKTEFNDGIIFKDVELDADAVADFYTMLEILFERYFTRISSEVENLSDEDKILNYIALKKREFKEIWDKQTEYGRVYGYGTPPLSVEARMRQFSFDEATAIQHREKSVRQHKIYETKIVFILKSLTELMTLHRKYSSDLLLELKRFDYQENIDYNDVPLVVNAIFNEPSVYSEWVDRLFDDFFKTLLYKINTEGDFKWIDIHFKSFTQIKKDLSEKGETKTNTIDSLDIPYFKKLYEQQHQYIDKTLAKLKELQDIYLPKSTVSEAQPLPKPEKSKQNMTSERVINTDKLSEYFTVAFKGRGQYVDHFSSMIEDLKTKRTSKEYAQIALMIFESKGKITTARIPDNFAEWLRIFCKCIDCEYVKYDNKKKLRKTTSQSLKSLFGYLY